MKSLFLLGSTGSIGTSTLRVVRDLAGRFSIAGLAAGRNTALLAQQCSEFHPRCVYSMDSAALRAKNLPQDCAILETTEQLCDAVCAPDVDIVLCAISGTAGLLPVLRAIEAGKTIALASKEILVMAGALVTAACQKHHVRLLPVDSEHCAIFQCIDGHAACPPRRIILTCSGGPFHAHPEINLADVTLAQTLHHPTWSMGKKITIDSATLMNKGLEMIEARWLFNMPENAIDVVIHPQSIVHSMVEFADDSILAQLGYPDMCLPIQYCLTYPHRVPGTARPLDFTQSLSLTFQPPDTMRFPALRLAREALRLGGTAGAVFNAANEIAVQAFVQERLRFDQIPVVVEKTLATCSGQSYNTLDELLEADAHARAIAQEATP